MPDYGGSPTAELRRNPRLALLLVVVALFGLSGCSKTQAWLGLNGTWLPSTGPGAVQLKEQVEATPIPVIAITKEAAERQVTLRQRLTFAEALPEKNSLNAYAVGSGDVLEVSVWEAPPAVLFSSASLDSRSGTATAKVTTFPEEMVAADGSINVPFAGAVPVRGLSPAQISAEIVRRLTGKAHQPQVMVRVIRNVSSNVTVIGEVARSLRMPLTAKGERLLDTLAAAGGVQHPVGQMTIQLSRDGQVLSMPLDSIIRDPKQDISLQPGDVITALFKSNNFTVLGASGKNDEIQFEAQGISLAQALGRIGGLMPGAADPKGLFIFRFEEPAALPDASKKISRTSEGKVPVIYQADLKNPATFLVMQKFPMQDKDVVYVATAPAAELQAFINIITSSVYSANTIANVGN
ncbi:polysaccharide biosynthesis/export family protein [Magnetospirillum molischianum]|uniref:Putative capsule polysaccharide export protein bexD n=1 Tax=Magnetospirillum molischianum DSM 120 TaxID=1150626 RepID=H8FX00_MAGML|nr:polysaccharide biosynthesis/export family protein [Magnetospirillum molischianum]CCG42888.1 putative capsule polysaccharide export protein bexD [Magnetospirillum molischianum DSM 120]